MRASLVLLACTLVLCGSVSHAQLVQTSQSTDDDGNVVFSVHMTSDDKEPMAASPFSSFFSNLRPFHMFSSRRSEFPRFMQLTQPTLEDKEPFPMFEHLFAPMHLQMDQLANSPTVSIEVRHLGDDESNDDDDEDDGDRVAAEMQNRMSTFFSRISSLFDSIRQQTANGGIQSQDDSSARRKGRRLGGCTLLQACGEDIDSVCGYAKRINIAQAIPRCLSSHRTQLSEKCGQYIDRFYSSFDESSETTTESSEAPSEQPAPAPQPTTPQQSCHTAAESLCPDLPAHNMVAVMSCLFRHREEVPDLCLNHIKETAAFNCAVDAERFCPGVSNRRDIGRCLKFHMKELSPACTEAAHKLKSNLAPAPVVHQPAVGVSHVVAADELKASSSDNFFQTHPQLALGLGLGAFVVIAVVAVIVTVRRRRRAQRVRLPVVVSSVQLVNPTTQ